MANQIITADSYPDYNSYGLFSSWTCDDYIQWHKLLVIAKGKDQADAIWKKGFSGQSSLANDYNWCKYNTAFADYFTSQGIDVTDVLSEVATGATKIGENVLGAATTASSIPQTLLNILKWLIPVLLIIGAIIAIIYFGKKYNVIKA